MREKMIEELVEKDIEDIKQSLMNGDYDFLTDVLRGNGWTGYDKLTDEEIEEEYKERIIPDLDYCENCGCVLVFNHCRTCGTSG